MKHQSEKRNNGVLKTLFTTALMFGAVTGAFYGITQVVAATEYNKVVELPTTYSIGDGSLSIAEKVKALDGYVKPDYKVVDNNLEFYRNSKPTSNDISREAAAEIGVQALWSVFGLDLNGQTIEMGYIPNKEIERAKWSGEYWISGQKGPDFPLYSFTVDAVTGEVYGVIYGRILDADVDLGYDTELARNPAYMEGLAQSYAEELNVIEGLIKSSTIAAQGYANNDPTVNFRITGENGQSAIIEMSRYDNTLLSVSYPAYVIEQDAVVKRIEQGMAEMGSELGEKHVEVKDSESIQLLPFE